jgi:nucleoside triphosphate pyrophosphatase
VSFEVLQLRETPGRPPDVDEMPSSDETPGEYAKRVAHQKAEVAWQRLTQRRLMRHPVLSADTTVDLDDQILGKPMHAAEAVAFLERLSGSSHWVHTAVAVAHDARVEVALSSTQVQFRELRSDEIEHYVASGEPLDKAGAYAIQGRAAVFVRSISGSYSGVVGLPLFETSELLARFGHRIL